MLEINIIVNTFDSSAAIPDGLLNDWFDKLVKSDEEAKSSIVKNVVVSGYVQMVLLIAKDYKKEIKIHQITELNNKGEIVGIHNKVNGSWNIKNIENIESLNVLENILWTML